MSQPIKLVETERTLSLLVGENKLTLHHGDILSLKADAIICPVDQNLDLRTGLAKIISQAAGKKFRAEKPLSAEPYGKVVVLPGGKLPAKYIFLAVVVGERGLDKIRLSICQAVERAIHYAEFLRIKSIAFPVLGSPQAAPPYQIVANEMLEDVLQYFQRRNTKLKAVFFSVFNEEAFTAFRKEAKDLATQ